MRSGGSIKHNVHRGKEQNHLDLQEGKVDVQKGWDSHETDSSEHEDRVVVYVRTISEQVNVAVKIINSPFNFWDVELLSVYLKHVGRKCWDNEQNCYDSESNASVNIGLSCNTLEPCFELIARRDGEHDIRYCN